jgi:hypothetical protein
MCPYLRDRSAIVEGIDSAFFSKASDKEQKSLAHILAKLTAGTTDE